MKIWLWMIGVLAVAGLIIAAIVLNWGRISRLVTSESSPSSESRAFTPDTSWTCGDLTVMNRKAAKAPELTGYRPKTIGDVKNAKSVVLCPPGILTKVKLADTSSVFDLTTCQCCDRATGKCE